jgi:hypothetical protein
MVVDRSLCYNEVYHLSPLLCQWNKGRAFWCHALDRFHDSLQLHGIEVQIQILDHPSIGRSGIERLRSPNGGISAGAIVNGSPFGATMKMKQPSLAESPQVLIPISG